MDYKNLSKLAATLSSVALLLIFYILNNAPQKQPDLAKELKPVKLEMQKMQQRIRLLAS